MGCVVRYSDLEDLYRKFDMLQMIFGFVLKS